MYLLSLIVYMVIDLLISVFVQYIENILQVLEKTIDSIHTNHN